MTVAEVTGREFTCERCGCVWRDAKRPDQALPKRCRSQKCKSALWNTKKVKFGGGAKKKNPATATDSTAGSPSA